jgi:hypothetical protein
MLFSPNELSSKPQQVREQGRRRLPTGSPRLMESASARLARLDAETWASLLTEIRRSALARRELLEVREGSDQIPCPWSRLVTCEGSCRCGGSGTVTVGFLLDHYRQLPLAIVQLVQPTARRPLP